VLQWSKEKETEGGRKRKDEVIHVCPESSKSHKYCLRSDFKGFRSVRHSSDEVLKAAKELTEAKERVSSIAERLRDRILSRYWNEESNIKEKREIGFKGAQKVRRKATCPRPLHHPNALSSKYYGHIQKCIKYYKEWEKESAFRRRTRARYRYSLRAAEMWPERTFSGVRTLSGRLLGFEGEGGGPYFVGGSSEREGSGAG